MDSTVVYFSRTLAVKFEYTTSAGVSWVFFVLETKDHVAHQFKGTFVAFADAIKVNVKRIFYLSALSSIPEQKTAFAVDLTSEKTLSLKYAINYRNNKGDALFKPTII
jgi:hypothetical protein